MGKRKPTPATLNLSEYLNTAFEHLKAAGAEVLAATLRVEDLTGGQREFLEVLLSDIKGITDRVYIARELGAE